MAPVVVVKIQLILLMRFVCNKKTAVNTKWFNKVYAEFNSKSYGINIITKMWSYYLIYPKRSVNKLEILIGYRNKTVKRSN
jgi:hypothetical protein